MGTISDEILRLQVKSVLNDRTGSKGFSTNSIMCKKVSSISWFACVPNKLRRDNY